MKGGILCSLAFHHQAVCPCHHNTQLGMLPPDGDPDANSPDAPPECLNAPPCPPVPAKSTSGSSKPHRAHGDLGWRAIQAAGGGLTLARFRLLRRLGGGDIGSVYLCKLRGTEGGGALFAMKVMDKAVLGVRNKLGRVETERAILELLDHPFLPTLYAHLDTPQLSCMVMDFCAGGDLHVLRQLQPGRRFSEQATRFYAAEVLLAFEYLHMMGIIYRDLKPENVLVREDGHIMLSDFDLSLRCQVSPTLSLPRGGDDEEATASPTSAMSCHCYFCSRLSRDSFLTSSCITPCGVHPVASCLPIFPRHRRKPRGQHRHHPRPHNPAAHGLPELVAEPTSVRSMSFVGTHEYLAPEIVAGHGHGSAVDWWTFGVFLFEMLYGRTPFKGPNNHKTLTNIVTQALQFPPLPLEEDEDENDDEEEEGEGEESDVNEKEEAADVDEGEEEALVEEPSEAVKQLMRGLLSKDPRRRLASVRGAAEIRQHRFFQGVNWALIRCSTPPWIPPPFTPPPPSPESASKNHPPHPFPGDDGDDDGDGDDNDEEERAPCMVIEGFPPGYTPNFEPF